MPCTQAEVQLAYQPCAAGLLRPRRACCSARQAQPVDNNDDGEMALELLYGLGRVDKIKNQPI